MYLEINWFVRLLHKHSISAFLVTNAQFPDEIRNLEPVTQLYVSVDASTKESLKRIDRPLFKDFWQRFLDSLKALSEKGCWDFGGAWKDVSKSCLKEKLLFPSTSALFTD
ncbi:S-adenosyl-L-methionine-dependent tRNA 4-demethylwyosine synthase TYW1-like [Neopsephotus bourkii]|uniref:S-adenosyl-L-methionine-dependent tRNA 4-demethylwyosine synthase TYW1-like n=1 Tax=Neopsephotus bourkii TaxID=309878 RepID=UPI002AA5562F|nr:S-adenosyl-L-methionine-dependent tRNA 4-demethylwyosine synthase TYW1-like [Neopsephotus bourkii]